MGTIFYAAFGGENHTIALRARENPPLVAGATTFPRKRGHYKAPLCCELLMKGLLFRVLFCPLNRGGKVRRSRIEVASAASQSPECVSNYMIHKANPVTLTLKIAAKPPPQPSA